MCEIILEKYFWQTLATILTLTFTAAYLYLTWTFNFWKKQGVPGNIPRPFLGTKTSLNDIALHEQDYANHTKYGRVYGGFDGKIPVLFITDPEMIKQAFVKDSSIFVNRQRVKYHEATPVVGKSLFYLRDEEWKRTRDILTPTFSLTKMKQMVPLIFDCLEAFIPSLEKYAEKNEPIDAKIMFSSLTLDIIANCAFATQTDSSKNPENAFALSAEKIFNPSPITNLLVMFPEILPYISFLKPFIEDPFKFLKGTAAKMISVRKKHQVPQKKDFIDLLLQAEATEEVKACTDHRETKILTHEVLVAQCVQFLLAGQETTATTLAMMAYCLALNPAVQERLINEIDVASTKNGIANFENCSALEYMDMVLSETLRMYGPVNRIDRTCDQDDYKLDGITLGKDTLVTLSLYSLHHDEKFYPDPQKFDPERFSPEMKENRNPLTYLPFGIGPRKCIARRFALNEIKLVMAHVLSSYRFQACGRTEVPMKFLGTNSSSLQPQSVTVLLQKRSDKS